jgi:hypothetical protein
VKRTPAEEYDYTAGGRGEGMTHNYGPNDEDGDVQECHACLTCVLEQVSFVHIPVKETSNANCVVIRIAICLERTGATYSCTIH